MNGILTKLEAEFEQHDHPKVQTFMDGLKVDSLTNNAKGNV